MSSTKARNYRRRIPLISLGVVTLGALLFQGVNMLAPEQEREESASAGVESVSETVGSGTYENGSSAVVATGTWSGLSSIYDSAGSVTYATKTASVSLTFTGTTVSWLSRETASSGINDVYIDGAKVASVDRYSSVNTFKETVWTTSSLSAGTHTIKVAYTGTKNPASSSANVIFDAFVVGAVAEPVGPTVGAGTYEATSAAMRFSGTWSTMSSPSDSDGSSGYLNGAGWAKLTFQGKSVQWISRTTASSGTADVWLDGVKVASIDRYSSETLYQQTVFEKTGLSNTVHTIKIEWTGRKNAASTGTNVLLDSIVVADAEAQGPTVGIGVYEATSTAMRFSGTWSTQSSPSDSAGSSGYLNTAGWAKLTFQGRAIQWVSRTTPSSGVANVWLDGVKVATVDRYSSQTLYQQVVFERVNLTDAVHTIKVEWTGNKNASSTGTNLLLDSIVVPNTVEPQGPTVGIGVYEATSTSLRFAGAWSTQGSPSDSDGSSGYLNSAGWAKLTFDGPAVQWLSRTTPSSGIANIWLDGVKVSTVDRYSAQTLYKQVVFEKTDLTDAVHTIKIEWSGQKATAATGTNLLLDAIVVPNTVEAVGPTVGPGVYEANATALRFSGAWSEMASTSDSGGSSGYLNSPGWTKLTFNGDAIRWLSRTSSSSGIADVWLDGQKVATVDRYSAETRYGQPVYENMDLVDGVHTIKVEWTGRKNAASSGTNLLLDAIVVPDTTAPSTPVNVRASSSGGDVVLAWNAVPDPDIADYRVYRVNSTGDYQLIGRAPRTSTFFKSIGLPANANLRFSVTAVDTSGNESAKGPDIQVATGTTSAGSYRYANCPTATTTVTTVPEFKAAVTAARPGTVIRMAPGEYHGQLEIAATGTASQPIWICGSRDVILNGDGFDINSPINVNASSYLVVTGMTATNALKGVTVRASDHVTISDMLVQSIGYEGVHVRSNSTDTVVVGNTIRRTGQLDPFYGEGVYIGSSKNNWCTYTNCLPDKTDRIAVLDNTISETGSDLIEAKEGTTDGLISGNILDGTNGMARTESWIRIAGNDWVVTGNTGADSSKHGYSVNGALADWGLRTTFSANTSDVNAAGYGYDIWELNGTGSSDTLVSCGNTVRAAASGFATLPCSR